MDNFNNIGLESVHIEHCEEIDQSRMREFRKFHPEVINRIDHSYNEKTNIVTAIYYSDSIITHGDNKYYAHAKLVISYEPARRWNESHDHEIDSLVSRMSKFGGWVYSSINMAVIRYFNLDKEVNRGYGH